MFRVAGYKKLCLFLAITFFMNFSGITVLATSASSLQDQMVGTDEVRVVVSSLQDTLRAGDVPDVGTLILLDAIKDQVASQLQDAEYEYESIKGSLSYTEIAEADLLVEEGIIKTDALIAEISMVISSPVADITVQQLDVIIGMLDESDKVTYGSRIVHVKPEVSKSVVSGHKIFNPKAIKAVGADPVDEDLMETPETLFTPELIELATSLNNDPVEICTWVRNEIDYEPYYGSQKGANETYIDRAGNDIDTSSLAIALLRISGVPARYYTGDVKLKIDDLKNWVGVPEHGTAQAAVDILRSNWIPTEILYDNKGEIEGANFDHIWIGVYDGHIWRAVDPSYKKYTYIAGDVITPEQQATIDGVISNDTVTIEDDNISIDMEALQGSVEAAAEVLEGYNFGSRYILINEKNALPPYLARGIIGARKPAEEFREIPEALRFKFKISFPTGDPATEQEPYICNMSDVADKNVSLCYTMAESCFLNAAGSGSIFDVSPLFTFMLPKILINNEEVYQSDVSRKLGTNYHFQTSIWRPGNDVWEDQNRTETSGTSTDIYVCTQKTSNEFLQRKIDALQKIVEESGLTEDMTQEMISDNLAITNRLYFMYMDLFSDMISDQLGIVNTNHINVSFVTDDIKVIGFFGLVLQIAKGGVTIDIVRSANNPRSIINDNSKRIEWMYTCGSYSTAMEHIVLELVYNIPAVSTGKIFSEALRNNIPICLIQPETMEADLARISANSVVKNHIRTYVSTGYEAAIPQSHITLVSDNGQWSGYGWTVTNPTTGATGYMISGGLRNMILNGGSLAEHVNNSISNAIQQLSAAESAILGGVAGSGVLVVICGLVRGALYIMANHMAAFAVACHIVTFFFLIIAVCLAVAMLCCYTTWLRSYLSGLYSILKKRRKDYYFA